MFGNPNGIPGNVEGPSSADDWKRAVYRAPPSKFVVEMLPPIKLAGSYNFQMRICPISRGDRTSVSSRGSNTEYDVVRRWEDCLWFQDTLEREYARLALSKRQRLVAGKGVRKNGMYLQDKASSWESLPPGPDPDSVAQTIHAYLPRLTKKGTVFRASQATVDQRQAELTAFIAALFMDDVPTLLDDFRKERTVTDFFGFWRKDQDVYKAANKAVPKARSSVSSISTSPRSPTLDSSSESGSSRSRALSTASSDSSSSPSSGSARSSMSVQITLDDGVIPFGHNPHHGLDNLEPLNEASETSRKTGLRGGLLAAVSRKIRKTAAADKKGQSVSDQKPRPDSRLSTASTVHRAHRESWQTTASGMTFLDELNVTMPTEPNDVARNPSRLSTASFMTDVSADAIIPRSPHRPDSRATLGRSLSSASRGHKATPSADSDEDSDPDECFYDAFPSPCSFVPEEKLSESSTLLVTTASAKTSLAPLRITPGTPVSLPNSPLRAQFSPTRETAKSEPRLPKSPPSNSPDSPKTPLSSNFYQRSEFLARSPSPNGSIVSSSLSVLSSGTLQSSFSDSTSTTVTPSMYSFASTATSPSTPTALTIKAAHNSAIILLRADRDSSFDEIRRRLREKFLGQENVTLSESFTLAYTIPATPIKPVVKSRNRSNSTGGLGDTALMETITTSDEWARLVSTVDGAKLTLRVMDSSARMT